MYKLSAMDNEAVTQSELSSMLEELAQLRDKVQKFEQPKKKAQVQEFLGTRAAHALYAKAIDDRDSFEDLDEEERIRLAYEVNVVLSAVTLQEASKFLGERRWADPEECASSLRFHGLDLDARECPYCGCPTDYHMDGKTR